MSVQATFAATLVDEWIRAGMTDVVVCPGSRSTPLALALAERPELAVHVRLDERGSGFLAVGIARGSGRPVAICVTSGTAAAELHPAVLEASHGRVPILVLTADRPPELRDVGASQTIDQHRLFGAAPRWFADPGVARVEDTGTWRALGARAYREAAGALHPPGPVHLNLPFRDPLVGSAGPLPEGRPQGAPWVSERVVEAKPVDVSAWAGMRGVIVAGAGADPSVVAVADALGWPLLADPRSGLRGTVGAAHWILADEGRRADLRPEVAVLAGESWISKYVGDWIASSGRVVAVDPAWRGEDPQRVVGEVIRGPLRADPAGEPWGTTWGDLQAAATSAVAEVLENAGWSEPGVAAALPGMLPTGTPLHVASSMPVRDLEWFADACPGPVHANRGVSGIDGLVATTLGISLGTSRPTVGLLGDLAFLHDLASCVLPSDGVSGSAILVVLDNAGGGIFSFLPQASQVDPHRFEQLFGTAMGVDPLAAARGLGLPADEVTDLPGLADCLGRLVGRHPLAVVVCRMPPRDDHVALHESVRRAVDRKLAQFTL